MLKAAICDDNAPVCSQIEKILNDYNHKIQTNTSIFYSPEKFLDTLKSGEIFDLVFLDIEFPDSNGVEIGRIIREELKNDIIHIIYISAKENYAMQLFDNRPLHFLIKPLCRDKIIALLQKVEYLQEKANKIFSCTFNNKAISLFYKDIIYFESKGRKIHIFTSDENYEFNGTIKNLIKNINMDSFLQIHKSIVVNSTHIREHMYESITLTGGACLPISRTYRKSIRERLLKNRVINL
ncbi:MAG: LytTR family DNA-binding domain-containing protein [Defluviitaleaceae bacterium]|nr:LytTR family DNA-binding domain-containing protein [Defluviitaleaceae bacterium]